MDYDLEHEAKACVNELFYRNGPRAEAIVTGDADYVRETIERYMQEAFEAGRKHAVIA